MIKKKVRPLKKKKVFSLKAEVDANISTAVNSDHRKLQTRDR